jgi:hypothetical protein
MNENNGNNETLKTENTEKIRKKDLIKQYQEELNKLNSLPDDSSDSEIEIINKPPPQKKERTQAQKDAFERARIARETKVKQRKEENENFKQSQQKELEDKLIKKAISTKKKQLKEISKKIEEESDTDIDERPINTKTPIIKKKEEIVKKISYPVIVEQSKPKYKFL